MSNVYKVKSNVDRVYIDKIETSAVALSKLSNDVKNDVVRKAVYDKLVIN